MFSLLFVVVSLSLFSLVSASTIGYDAILAIVIAELVFAFSVGVVCIVFSFNLFRTLKDSQETYGNLPTGDLPPRLTNVNNKNSQNNLVNGGTDPFDYSTFHERETYSFGSDAEMDYEGRADDPLPDRESESGNVVGVMGTFGSYLKFW